MASFFSKKCEYGLQAILYLPSKGNDLLCSAEEISTKLNIPKEFTSKILQDLTEKGIIISRKGRVGGFKLAVNGDQIKLIDIVEAIDGVDIFNNCVMGFKNCNSEKKCPLHNHWDEIINKAYLMLSTETIDEYKDKTICQPFWKYIYYFFAIAKNNSGLASSYLDYLGFSL